MIAGDVIDAARGHHETFDRFRHTNKVCLQQLRRAESDFFGALSDQGMLQADVVYDADAITAALAGTPLGEGESDGFPAFMELREAQASTQYGIQPVDLIQSEGDMGSHSLRIRVIRRQLYLTQPAAVLALLSQAQLNEILASWSGVLALRVTYVPMPGDVTALTDVLETPDYGRDYLVGSLVRFLALRSKQAELPEKPELMQEGKDMMDATIAEAMKIGGREGGWQVQRVI